ncbi:hypothetical protein FG167_10970 [Lacinutrix sp. WUR7]|uniref:hypothetical protein n=1 Tax=Lacinutrix sp. WUR7 TaxID=2653681 RepID=UPI00193DFCD5|nr:hypothetical protein [Lacinutrix sp. WUR7]QRM89724.1 hypothetical protein FG167_10970 [Lacinutrix sp. WUR7]
MQFKKTLVFVFICLSFLACCNNDDDNQNETQEHAIHGTWNLSNVSGGFVGIDIDYNRGEVVWTFNDNNKQLIVENNIMTTGPEQIYSGLNTGNYTYEIQEIEDTEVLYIDGNTRGVISISNTTLTIDDGVAADGFLTTFER